MKKLPPVLMLCLLLSVFSGSASAYEPGTYTDLSVFDGDEVMQSLITDTTETVTVASADDPAEAVYASEDAAEETVSASSSRRRAARSSSVISGSYGDAVIPSYITAGTLLDAEYGFALSKKTGSLSDYTECDYFTSTWTVGDGDPDAHAGNVYRGRYIYYGETQWKGNLWMQWNNVGTYDGKVLSLRCTLMDYDEYGIPNNDSVPKRATIQFSCDYVGSVQVGTLRNPKFRFEFLTKEDDGTYSPVSVKGHGTLYDIDADQGVILLDNVTDAYILTGYDFLKQQSADGWIYAPSTLINNDDKQGWITFFYDGSYFDMLFNVNVKWGQDVYQGYTAENQTIGGGHSLFGFIPDSVSAFDYPGIEKGLTDQFTSYTGQTLPQGSFLASSDTDTQEIGFYIHVYVPKESSAYYYDSFVITDMLGQQSAGEFVRNHYEGLVFTGNYTVRDMRNASSISASQGTDLTNLFTVSQGTSAEIGAQSAVPYMRFAADASDSRLYGADLYIFYTMKAYSASPVDFMKAAGYKLGATVKSYPAVFMDGTDGTGFGTKKTNAATMVIKRTATSDSSRSTQTAKLSRVYDGDGNTADWFGLYSLFNVHTVNGSFSLSGGTNWTSYYKFISYEKNPFNALIDDGDEDDDAFSYTPLYDYSYRTWTSMFREDPFSAGVDGMDGLRADNDFSVKNPSGGQASTRYGYFAIGAGYLIPDITVTADPGCALARLVVHGDSDSDTSYDIYTDGTSSYTVSKLRRYAAGYNNYVTAIFEPVNYTIVITKKDAEGNTITSSPASFQITGADGSVYTGSTGSSGAVSIAVGGYQDYTVSETAAPSGYAKGEDVVISKESLAADSLSGIYTMDFVNAAFGNLTLTVKDSSTGGTLSGVNLDLTAPDGSVEFYTTDENGQVVLTKRAKGVYGISQTSVLPGYIVTDQNYTAEVETGVTTQLVIYNDPGPEMPGSGLGGGMTGVFAAGCASMILSAVWITKHASRTH